jgi:hypothetical protein
MFCQQCSAPNPDGVNFCRVCGADMRRTQQPARSNPPSPDTGGMQQQYPQGQRLLRLLGSAFLSLGLVIFALLIIFALLARSVGLIELLIVLIISSILIGLGLLLRYLSRTGSERNRVLSSGRDTAELAERRRGRPLAAGTYPVAPVSSVTEATTELLGTKKEVRVGK